MANLDNVLVGGKSSGTSGSGSSSGGGGGGVAGLVLQVGGAIAGDAAQQKSEAEAAEISNRGNLLAQIAQRDFGRKAKAFTQPFDIAGAGQGIQDRATRALDTSITAGDRFEVSEGLRRMSAAAAAQGKSRSGENLRNIGTFLSNITNQQASTKYGRLLDLTNLGAQSASTAANVATATGNITAGTVGGGAQIRSDLVQARGNRQATNIAAGTQAAAQFINDR